jgi:hypothetical protein
MLQCGVPQDFMPRCSKKIASADMQSEQAAVSAKLGLRKITNKTRPYFGLASP